MKASLMKGSLIAIAVAALLGAGLVASGNPQKPPDGEAQAGTGNRLAAGGTRVSEGGRVRVAVSWDGLAQGQGDRWTLTLRVSMDTHSVDLDAYDLAVLAFLRNDRGEAVQPASWEAPRGGHHRKGSLTFTVPASFLAGARLLELVVRDVAGVRERVLRWELGVAS